MAIKGYWRLNGNSNDASGNGNNGTDTGIVYSQANGKIGQGAGFDATGDKILIANESNFDFERTQAFTISCWSKMTHSASEYHFFVCKQVAGGNYNGWALWENNSTLLFELVSTPALLNTITSGLHSEFSTTNKVHIVATYDGSGRNTGMKLFQNGVLISTINRSYNTLGSNSILNNTQVELGNRNGAFNFNGSLDEVIVDATEWSPAKVKNEYARAIGFF